MLMASQPERGQMAVDKNKPRVVSVVALDGRDESALFALAASLATGLDTPLATAILESAREPDIQIRTVDGFHVTTRAGVAGSVAGHTVVLGNPALFADLGLSVESLGDWPERLRQRGQHVLFVAIDGRTAGFFGVVDADK
jgi:cation transport ATPase